MLSTLTDPITADWPSFDPLGTTAEAPPITATALSERLGQLAIADIDATWIPHLAAAATELAGIAAISLRLSADDPAVALLRVIARATIVCPEASGPHTSRLFELID